MMIPRSLALAVVIALFPVFISDVEAQQRRKAPAKAAPAAVIPAACTDFYKEANASWLAKNPLPANTPAITALGQLSDNALQQQKQLLEAAVTAPKNEVQKLLGDFWASGLNQPAIEADGFNPIKPLLSRINAIKKPKDIPAAIAALHQIGIPVVFNFTPDVDLNALDQHIGYFMQGGIGLTDPTFYSRTDPETVAIMVQYRNYIKQILLLTGSTAAKVDAEVQAIMDLESSFARYAQSLSGINNPFSNYALISVEELKQKYPNLQLGDFLAAQGITDEEVSMADPALFAQLNNLVKTVKPDHWKVFFRWRVADSMAPYLSKNFRDAELAFRGRILRGQTEPLPQWQFVLETINTAAGAMLGREYTAQFLSADTQQQAHSLAKEILAAQIKAVERSTWLSAAAKAEAIAKLNTVTIEVGAPKDDLDFTIQPMGRGSFGSNILIASTWQHREEMKRIGKQNAVRRWNVLPQQPALTYDIAQNRLLITSAVLQAPVWSTNTAMRYGSFGGMVGHELNSAIDDRGNLIDSQGKLRAWWTDADKTAWNKFGGRLVNQFNAYPFPALNGVNVDGALTMNGNLADLAGVELAWDAFNAAQTSADTTSKQAFFNGWASLWAQQLSPNEAMQRVSADIRAPGIWRTNGVVTNLPVFAAAFSCKAGQPMQRAEADQTRIWR